MHTELRITSHISTMDYPAVSKGWPARLAASPEILRLPHSFGTGMQRPKFGKSKFPRPGAYRLKPDMGKQFDSRKHSSSNAVFPVATKACTEKVGIKPAVLLASCMGQRASVGKQNRLCQILSLLHGLPAA